eukprot:3010486-Rhodomonas_salina.1
MDRDGKLFTRREPSRIISLWNLTTDEPKGGELHRSAVGGVLYLLSGLQLFLLFSSLISLSSLLGGAKGAEIASRHGREGLLPASPFSVACKLSSPLLPISSLSLHQQMLERYTERVLAQLPLFLPLAALALFLLLVARWGGAFGTALSLFSVRAPPLSSLPLFSSRHAGGAARESFGTALSLLSISSSLFSLLSLFPFYQVRGLSGLRGPLHGSLPSHQPRLSLRFVDRERDVKLGRGVRATGVQWGERGEQEQEDAGERGKKEGEHWLAEKRVMTPGRKEEPGEGTRVKEGGGPDLDLLATWSFL